MSRMPEDLRYSATHQWARLGADGLVVVGITDHAQEALGDVLFCELPAVGTRFAAGDQSGTVESLKAASDVYAPVSGEVVAQNPVLAVSPERVNEDPYGDGWFYTLRPETPAELDALLDAAGYAAMLGRA
jgi:glycine cleavage system H protein